MVELGFNIFFGGIGLLAILAALGLVVWIFKVVFGGFIREGIETETLKGTLGVIFFFSMAVIIGIVTLYTHNY
ncbi:TPA: hypothetical protein NQG77_000249 [Salmonella enterica subsp. enterica serovar Infantis]|nr:hypothetical protein [Salmonella enterica subsp. enterica serovar Infantis]